MSYKTIHTNAGLIAMAEAEAQGTAINLTEMAIGDGNGNPADPDPQQTALVRERYRSTINRVWQDPENPQRFTAELIIPASEGGFTLREVGVFDENGTLFAVGNLPAAYKPTAAEGSFSDAVMRMEFMVANADVVTLQVDPNVTVPSQAWVINNITPGFLIPGGTTGQVLAKQSNADGDTVWQDPDVANITVDIIDELQTLATNQTVVDLTNTTTYGLAVYIDGLRINRGSQADQWQPDPTIETKLTLGQSYPDGTEIYLVQNEPNGSSPAPLERSKNLSDLQSKSAARTNMDVHSKSESNAAGQPGDIKYSARNTAPTGWLKANGAAISRTAYPELFAVIGTQYGEGDGFSTFNLPDLRGEFIRGWDDGRGVDGGRAIGSAQGDENRAHSHSATSGSSGAHSHSGAANSAGAHSHNASTGTSGWHSHSYRDGYYIENLNSLGGSGPDGYFGVSTRKGSGDTDSDNNRIPYVDRTTGGSGNHSHSVSVGSAGSHSHTLNITNGGDHTHSIAVDQSGGIESRPRNIAMLALIKY